MRQFQFLIVMLLAAITVELGLLVIKFPTPTAQAGPSTTTAPSTGLQDPHDLINARLDRLDKGLADVTRELATNRQQTTALAQKMEKDHADDAEFVKSISEYVHKAGAVWVASCHWVGQLRRDVDPHPMSPSRVDPCELRY